jgi:C1A family cysteine protease
MQLDNNPARALARGAAVFSALALLLSGAAARAALLDLKQAQIEIDRQGGGWVARPSWVTELDRAQAQRLLGAQMAEPTGVDFSSPRWFSEAAPEAFDWRNKDGQNWVSPVLNQGSCGSCVAFAAVATFETQMNVSSGLSWLNPRYSTQALFSCGGGGCESGWMPSQAARYMVSTGVPDEACAPYTMGATGEDVKCESACQDAGQRSVKAVSYSQPSSYGNEDAVKAALRKGPLVTTLYVYADFMAYGSGVYKHATGGGLGGHAVSIIGFDDAKRAWLIRNSWGTDWGMGGFAYVSYDDTSGVSQQTWQFEAPGPAGYVAIRNLRDRDYLQGVFPLRASAAADGATGIKAAVFDQGGQSVASLSCAAADCELPLDTTALPDGRYELRAESVGGSAVAAQPRFFYVANAKPALTLDFQPSGFDIAAPLKGRVVFTVTSSSSTVPLSSLDFVALKDGKQVVRRRSDIALPTMVAGWRTNFVDNGAYEIYYVGHVTTNAGDTAVESRHITVQVKN